MSGSQFLSNDLLSRVDLFASRCRAEHVADLSGNDIVICMLLRQQPGMLQAEHGPASVGSHTSSGFTGRPFWHALRQSNVERDVRTLFADARQAVRRKGAIPLLVSPSWPPNKRCLMMPDFPVCYNLETLLLTSLNS